VEEESNTARDGDGAVREGEGRRLSTDRLGIEIPAGVRNGSRVELEGAGNAGLRGGPPGNLALVVHVESHPFYERRGDDLYCRVPVSMTEAALGAHIEVPTPTSRVTIEIPAGTQTGQRFRLRKRGVPHPGGDGRGDLYVEADVRVPRVVDDEARELLREFARRQDESPRAGLGASLSGQPRAERD
jgi:DnaJ-class molecular chaperone